MSPWCGQLSEDTMKGDVGQLTGAHVGRRQFTCPELIDHDYWSGSSIQPKRNNIIISTAADDENTTEENQENDVLEDCGNIEAYNLSNGVLIYQGSQTVITCSKYRCIKDKSFHRFFVCHYCGNTWNNMSQLTKHLETYHPSELELDAESHTVYNLGKFQMHSCLYCDYTVGAFDQLVSHIKSCHQVIATHCCPHCEYRTMLRASLKDHLSEKHRDTCLYCVLNIHA